MKTTALVPFADSSLAVIGYDEPGERVILLDTVKGTDILDGDGDGEHLRRLVDLFGAGEDNVHLELSDFLLLSHH